MLNLLWRSNCASMLARGGMLNRQPASICLQRNFSSAPNKTTAKDINTEWRVLYKLPLAQLASAFNRLKIYQAGLTVLSVPAAQMLVTMGEAPPEVTYVAAIVGVTGLTTLSLGSLAFKNLVGLIYINKTEDHLKLAYVDFWGRRQHTVLTIDEIVPEWEVKKPFMAFYQPIKSRLNNKETYKLIQRFGVVTDKTTFALIFD